MKADKAGQLKVLTTQHGVSNSVNSDRLSSYFDVWTDLVLMEGTKNATSAPGNDVLTVSFVRNTVYAAVRSFRLFAVLFQ